MSLLNKTKYTIFFLSVGVFLLYYFSSFSLTVNSNLKSEINNWQLVQYNNKGGLHVKLGASHGSMVLSSKVYHLDGVDLKLYNDNSLIWNINSDKAQLDASTKKMYLLGNVVAQSTDKPLQIKSKSLIIDINKHKMISDDSVQAVTVNSITNIPKLDVSWDNVQINMQDGFKTTYFVD